MVLMRKNTNTTKKKSLGRQKIEIKQLENKSSKQVTFSKRRSGLFKKSAELTVLCGANVAVIVFSPNNKVFCFGYPGVDSIINNYLFGTISLSSSAATTSAARRELMAVGEYNRLYREASKELEVAKKRGEEMKQIESEKKKEEMQMGWWEEKSGVYAGIGSVESEHYMAQLKEMRRKVANRLERLMTTTNTSTTTRFHGGNLGLGLGLGLVGGGGGGGVGSSSRSFGYGVIGGDGGVGVGSSSRNIGFAFRADRLF